MKSIHTFIIFLPFLLTIYTQECGCQSPAPAPAPENEHLTFLDQRLAVTYPIIQTFKSIITSDPFGITRTWVGSDICNYTGFICDHPPDNLTATTLAGINFNGFKLTAPSLNGFIDLLPDLAIFHANTNNFSGTITPKITQLRYLYEFDISNNKFSGVFPAALIGVSGLTFLDIRYNSFTGSVPPQAFMQTLDVLFLNNNNFMQTLPLNFGSTSAQYLTLANNKFTGPIPRSIGNLSSTLTEILLIGNLLTGCLPYELGLLTELTVFDVSNNLLTGPIPCSLGCLAKAEILNFSGNFFYGQIPESICGLSNVVNFSVSNNFFTRVGPICWNLIKNGVLDVRRNCIFGIPNQRSLKECALFRPRPCLYSAWSFTTIPCKLPSNMYSPPPPSKRSKKPSWVTYPSLLRHRL